MSRALSLSRAATLRTAAQANVVTLLDEAQSQELDSFLAERIYEFNSQATGYFDGKLLGGCIRDQLGEIIAGLSGHTWRGCCVISHLWVHERHRRQCLGRTLLRVAEIEARHRACERVVVMTHSFQAPKFYGHLGYERKYAIEDRPRGCSDIVYVKLLADGDAA
jgi:GNAT superfamily N-acetyltransferase